MHLLFVISKNKCLELRFEKQRKDIKPLKIFDAKKFAGKINWNEDPEEYQKRIRNEWN
jgi:hypothetical protein